MEKMQQHGLPLLDTAYIEAVTRGDAASVQRLFAEASPYFFSKLYQTKAQEFWKTWTIAPEPYVWSQRFFMPTYCATWIPSRIKTLFLCSDHDFCTPMEVFTEDPRFQGSLHRISIVSEAGHFSWLEQPEAVASAFFKFQQWLEEAV